MPNSVGPYAAAALGAAALAVAGCGGAGGSANASPTATVKSYLTSVATGNGAKACAALAPAVRATVVREAQAQKIKASSCPDLFGQVKAHMTAVQRKQFLTAKVTTASIKGGTATVTVAGASSQPTLSKQGGRWLITGGIGL